MVENLLFFVEFRNIFIKIGAVDRFGVAKYYSKLSFSIQLPKAT